MNNEAFDNPLPPVPQEERPLPFVTVVLLLAVSALTAALNPLFIPLAAAMTAFCAIRLNNYLVLLAILPAYPLALAFGASWSAALIALAPLPLAFALYKTAREQPRSVSVAFSAASLGVFMFLYGALALYLVTGQLSVTSLREYLDTQTAVLAESIVSSLELAAGENAESALQSYGLVNVDNVKAVFDAELPLLPGILFAILTAIAYIAHLIVSGLHCLFGAIPLPPDARRMRLSVISAYVYTIFYLLVILFASASADNSMLVIIGQNIITTLTLPFAIAGVSGIIARMRPSSGTLTPIVICFIAIVIGLFNPSALLSLAAFLGVIETFITHYGSIRNRDK